MAGKVGLGLLEYADDGRGGGLPNKELRGGNDSLGWVPSCRGRYMSPTFGEVTSKSPFLESDIGERGCDVLRTLRLSE